MPWGTITTLKDVVNLLLTTGILFAAAGRPRLFSDGPTMFNALSSVVGYLNAEGYCNNDKCHVSLPQNSSMHSYDMHPVDCSHIVVKRCHAKLLNSCATCL